MEVSAGGQKLSPEVESSRSGTSMEVNGGGEKLSPAGERSTILGTTMEARE